MSHASRVAATELSRARARVWVRVCQLPGGGHAVRAYGWGPHPGWAVPGAPQYFGAGVVCGRRLGLAGAAVRHLGLLPLQWDRGLPVIGCEE